MRWAILDKAIIDFTDCIDNAPKVDPNNAPATP